MQKYNIFKLLLFCSAFFIFNWIINTVVPFSNVWQLSEKAKIYNIFIDDLTYEGCQTLSIIKILPFAFSINYLIKDNHSTKVIRYKSRIVIFKNNLFNVILFSFLFSLIHEIINLIGLNLLFSSNSLLEMHIYKYTLINFPIMLLFFIQCSLIIQAFSYLTNKKFSYLFLLLYNCIFYFVFIKFFETNLIFFVPTIFPLLIKKSIDYKIILIIMIFGIVIDFALVYTCEYLFLRKDLINEKK